MNRKGISSRVILVFFVLIVLSVALLLWMASQSSPAPQVASGPTPTPYASPYGGYANYGYTATYGKNEPEADLTAPTKSEPSSTSKRGTGGYGGYGYGGGGFHYDPYEHDREFLKALLAWEAETGRKSAITLYAKVKFPDELRPLYNDSAKDLLKETLKTGWSERSEALLPLFPLCESGFSLIRDAAKLEDVGSPLRDHADDPNLNDLIHMALAQLMSVRAMYLAENGLHKEALRDLTAALRMGYAFQGGNADSISYVGGLACFSDPQDALRRVLERHDFDPSLLRYLAEIIAYWEEGRISYAQAQLNFALYMDRSTRNLMKESKSLKAAFIGSKMYLPEKKYLQFLGEIAQLEPREVIQGTHPAMVQYNQYRTSKKWPIGKRPSDCAPLAVREGLDRARIRLIAVAALMLADRAEGKPVAPPTAPGTLLDPFSGKPFLYDPNASEPFELRSVGPDLVPNAGRAVYDGWMKNGAFSGDIFFGKRKP